MLLISIDFIQSGACHKDISLSKNIFSHIGQLNTGCGSLPLPAKLYQEGAEFW